MTDINKVAKWQKRYSDMVASDSRPAGGPEVATELLAIYGAGGFFTNRSHTDIVKKAAGARSYLAWNGSSATALMVYRKPLGLVLAEIKEGLNGQSINENGDLAAIFEVIKTNTGLDIDAITRSSDEINRHYQILSALQRAKDQLQRAKDGLLDKETDNYSIIRSLELLIMQPVMSINKYGDVSDTEINKTYFNAHFVDLNLNQDAPLLVHDISQKISEITEQLRELNDVSALQIPQEEGMHALSPSS